MKVTPAIALTLLMSSSVMAQDIHIQGTFSKTIKAPIVQGKNSLQAPKIKTIKLLKVELSTHAQQILAARAAAAVNKTQQLAFPSNSKYPPQVELGMNDVPVLDQGYHGSCVTFASTAAVDAVLQKGDYVSQLCQLQLGNYLEKQGYALSGWDGSLGRFVLSQMDMFGIVPKEREAAQGCGGLHEYPLEGERPFDAMTPEEYREISLRMDDHVAWSPVLDIMDAFDRFDTNQTLTQVKASLSAGDRVTFGVLLLDFDLGTMGAVGTRNSTNDSWVLTPQIARDVYQRPFFGGHEMVITGYDDNAVAIDDEGREHRGLLTLRNSWGDRLGDHGDFYMSYDYFKLLVIEAQRIRSLAETDEGGDESAQTH
ncbi:peptidase C1 [Legionella sp. MW5194]|uniref:C1 family peptidase n=1 Tax=Legionella sp. MW5194 TaxID=2662448 RepID=UPI00193DEA1B|nr:C1 family peptidase [Legionella sp. MW5194]QRN04942.1 peptidase C1 [Legionella sp. MW5194]